MTQRNRQRYADIPRINVLRSIELQPIEKYFAEAAVGIKSERRDELRSLELELEGLAAATIGQPL